MSMFTNLQQTSIPEQIAIIWSFEDVQSVRPDLTKEQAGLVLLNLKHSHDAKYGISWDVIEVAANAMFPKEPHQISEVD